MRLSRFAVLALIMAWSVCLAATDQKGDAVDDYIRLKWRRNAFRGLALLVSRGGQVIRAQGFGMANVELQVPVTPETIFQSGSVGKQFTATAVMMLPEEGNFGLEDPLTKYLPDATAAWKHVTIPELLSHTAGFTDYPKDFDMRKITPRKSCSRLSAQSRETDFVAQGRRNADRSDGANRRRDLQTPRSVEALAYSSKHLRSAKWVLFVHSRPTLVSPSSRMMSESPSATAARIECPSDDQDTRRAMNVARSPKSVI
jgi:CubicO group peptidase (beta-lactamase class C family)